jgi:hypothetical protein
MAPKKSVVCVGNESRNTWIRWWLFLSGFVVLYDAGYVLLRPRSCEGGDFFFLWKPYKLYSTVDKLYSREIMEAGDGFNQAQAILNLAEVACHFISLHLWRNNMASGDILATLSQMATLWKTVLYWLNDLCRPVPYTHSDASWTVYFFVFFLPNALWIIFPSLVIYSLGKQITARIAGKNTKKS